MSAEPAGPGSIDCVQRGLWSLRANWELVPALFVQSLLTSALLVGGFLVLLTALGVRTIARLRDAGRDWPQRLAAELGGGLEAMPAPMTLLPPLLAAAIVWTLAFALYCYFQGGVVGILALGERRAGAGLPAWRSFRSFSVAGFDRLGRRLFWRYFWLNHLVAAVLLAWGLAAIGLAALAAWLAGRWGPAAGVTLGCTGLVPLALLLVAAAIWSVLATVDAGQPGAGVWAASRRALATLVRRPGTVFLIWLLAFCGWVLVGAAFLPLGWGVTLAVGDRWAVWAGARGLLAAAEALANSALIVGLLAALAALMPGRMEVAAE